MGRKKKIRICKDCGKTDNISQHNLCVECGIKRQKESIRQLAAKEGDIYDKWLKNTLAGLLEKHKEATNKKKEK